MKIIGNGVDIVDLSRIKNIDRLSSFFLLKEELLDLEKSVDKRQFMGSRIAIKESVIKAFPATLHYHDFKITKENNKIKIKFIDKKNQKFEVFCSLAHEFKYAIAYAIITKK